MEGVYFIRIVFETLQSSPWHSHCNIQHKASDTVVQRKDSAVNGIVRDKARAKINPTCREGPMELRTLDK